VSAIDQVAVRHSDSSDGWTRLSPVDPSLQYAVAPASKLTISPAAATRAPGYKMTSSIVARFQTKQVWFRSRISSMDSYVFYLTPALLLLAVIVIGASVRILREYERAVVFTLGRFQKVKGPGLVLLIPFLQEMVRVDLRIQVIEIPTQDVISRDNVSMKVDAVLYFNVVNPERAIIQVQHYLPATNMLAQTTLRAVLGQHELDEMLSERKKLSTDVQSIIDSQTEIWGIKVSNVEIRTVELTENMVRAIAKQAEAERDRRAKIIHAEAEFQASQTLVNAAKILSSVPAAMQLRYLQTLTEIGAEQNSTVVFPMPIDIIKPFLELIEQPAKAIGTNGANRPSLVPAP
jgi:regulator of protease activity HflC (stomatin/prohibitin superfamily)